VTGETVDLDPRRKVSTGRLLSTLGTAGALAGLLIVFVFEGTRPTIEAYKAQQLRLAIEDVLSAPDRFDTLYVVEDALVSELPAAADPGDFEQIYLGYRDGAPVGYAIAAGEPGFQDVVAILFGYDPATGGVLGMKVLESKETPGLGDKIEKDSSFVTQFRTAIAPLLGVKPRDNSGDRHEVDMITGATISSRTVIRTINNAVARFEPLLKNHWEVAER
jgi:electron transport complex protein RnfG